MISISTVISTRQMTSTPTKAYIPISMLTNISNLYYRVLLIIHRLARLLSSFIAAWFSVELLQSKKSDVFLGTIPYDTPNGIKHKATRYAGRTIDLTLFAVTRAVDVVVGELWSRHRTRRTVAGKWSKVAGHGTSSREVLTWS